jgi:hypothetical protein
MKKLGLVAFVFLLTILLTGDPSPLEKWFQLELDLNSYFSTVWLFVLILGLELFREIRRGSPYMRWSKRSTLYLLGLLLSLTAVFTHPLLLAHFEVNVMLILKPLMLLGIAIWAVGGWSTATQRNRPAETVEEKPT